MSGFFFLNLPLLHCATFIHAILGHQKPGFQACCYQDADVAASCHSSTFITYFAVIEILTSRSTAEAKEIDLSAQQVAMQPVVLRIPLVNLV